MKCNTCGIEDSEFDNKGEFLQHCKQCKKIAMESEPDNISDIIKAVLDGNAGDFDTEPDTAEDTAEQEEIQEIPSLPLSICPNEIGYLADNQLIKIVVIGRKQGDRFVVEGTKYR